jgi:hypothetical protein
MLVSRQRKAHKKRNGEIQHKINHSFANEWKLLFLQLIKDILKKLYDIVFVHL